MLRINPPATRTFPLGNNVAVWRFLATLMVPVAVNVRAAGFVEFSAAGCVATSDENLPVRQQRCRWWTLATVTRPVAVNVPGAGSYSSALAT